MKHVLHFHFSEFHFYGLINNQKVCLLIECIITTFLLTPENLRCLFIYFCDILMKA